MKILLVRPRPSAETIGLQHVMICEPLELEYLSASIADQGHEIVIVDMILEQHGVAHFLRQHKPDVVGLTGYITHVGIIRDYCRQAKALLPRCHTVVGGVHAEVVPSDFRDESIDSIVCANPLTTFRQLINRLASGETIDDVPGLWNPGKPRCIRETTFDYPPPDRGKVARYRSRYYYLFHTPCALIKTSFGCPYTCEFCFCRHVTGDRYFTRPLSEVIEELKGITEENIYIVDDNFLASRERVLEFCRRLQEAGLQKQFLAYGRADFIAANADVIETFKACGLRAVIVGLESFRHDELDLYNKRSNVADNEEAVRVLQRHGVDCYATLILGMDWRTSDFADLATWLRELDLTFVNLQPFTPLPGTPLLERHRSQLVVPRSAHEQWDLAHLVLRPTAMSPARYYWHIIRLYQKVALRPINILRLLRRHGIRANGRMLAGSSRVLWQYVCRMLREWRRCESKDITDTTVTL